MLLIAVAFSLVFLGVPNVQDRIWGFVYEPSKLRPIDWIYYVTEHIQLIYTSYLLYSVSRICLYLLELAKVAQSEIIDNWRSSFKIFVPVALTFHLFQWIDFIDYFLTFNTEWFHIDKMPIDVNNLMIISMGSVTALGFIKQQLKH